MVSASRSYRNNAVFRVAQGTPAPARRPVKDLPAPPTRRGQAQCVAAAAIRMDFAAQRQIVKDLTKFTQKFTKIEKKVPEVSGLPLTPRLTDLLHFSVQQCLCRDTHSPAAGFDICLLQLLISATQRDRLASRKRRDRRLSVRETSQQHTIQPTLPQRSAADSIPMPHPHKVICQRHRA